MYSNRYFQYFTSKEFFPSCTSDEIVQCVTNGYLDNLLILVQFLDGLRDYVGSPIHITSSYRNYEHNKKVGGVSTSQHLLGQAVDFTCRTVPFNALKQYVREYVKVCAFSHLLGQIIFYNKRFFIHVALRTPSHPKIMYYEN